MHRVFMLMREEQLHATETALGFLLPLVLRALYAEVANGGFGPGGGIQGHSAALAPALMSQRGP